MVGGQVNPITRILIDNILIIITITITVVYCYYY